MLLDKYGRQGKILLILLFCQIILTIGYKTILPVQGMFYIGMATGIGVLVYAATIRCRVCNKFQVFTGLSFLDLKIPKKKCFYCNNSLEE